MSTVLVSIPSDVYRQYMAVWELDNAMQSGPDGFDRKRWDQIPTRIRAKAYAAGFYPRTGAERWEYVLDVDDVLTVLRECEWALCDAVRGDA